jgi:thiamine biosynthesis lipoprotein
MPRELTRRELFSRPRADAPSGHWIRVHRSAMACRFEVTLAGEDALHVAAAQEALAEVERIEDVLTVFRDSSEVSRVNRDAGEAPVPVSETLARLLDRCRTLHRETGGAFDPSAAALSQCWGFHRREGRLPSVEEVEAAMAEVGLDKLELEPEARAVRFLRSGLGLNFGAVGKGYALDLVAERMRRRGVPRALLSAGGSSVLAFGGGDEGYAVDVRSPRASGVLAQMSLRDAALGTSGAGEQFFEAGGKRYGHVLDPRTGWPAEGVLSASAVGPSAADCDALSTAFLVAGPELAESYCGSHPGTLALLVLEAEPERALLFGECDGAVVARS